MATDEGAAGRLEGEHAAGAARAGWSEDVRVDTERQREILHGSEGPHAHGAFGAPLADVRQPDEEMEHVAYTYVDRRATADQPAWTAAPATAPGAATASTAVAAPQARREPDGLARALVRGAIAGAIGALAMSLTHRASSKVLLGAADAAPNPAKGAAEALGERAGVELSDRQADAGGTALMVGYGALLGAVYGVVHERVPSPALVNALALGGVSYAATVPEKGLLPRLGLVAPPTEQAVLAAMVPMDAHLAYGVATAAAYEAMS